MKSSNKILPLISAFTILLSNTSQAGGGPITENRRVFSYLAVGAVGATLGAAGHYAFSKLHRVEPSQPAEPSELSNSSNSPANALMIESTQFTQLSYLVRAEGNHNQKYIYLRVITEGTGENAYATQPEYVRFETREKARILSLTPIFNTPESKLQSYPFKVRVPVQFGLDDTALTITLMKSYTEEATSRTFTFRELLGLEVLDTARVG